MMLSNTLRAGIKQPCRPHLTAQVEGIAEPRLLALLGGERLDGLQVEVVVQVQVVEVLAVDEQVEHVVALAADLRGSGQHGMHSVVSQRTSVQSQLYDLSERGKH